MLNDHEWPSQTLEHMTTGIIRSAKLLREKSSSPMVPSPDPQAHVRFKDGTSRHDIGFNGRKRKSDATDLFLLNNKDAARVWQQATAMSEFGGIGIYFDAQLNGKQQVLIHIDNRSERLMWVCPSRDREHQKRSYIYFREENPEPFLRILADEFYKARTK